MYGTLFFFIGVACLAAYFIFVAGVGSIGFLGLFWISFGFNVIAFLLGFIVPEYYVWKKWLNLIQINRVKIIDKNRNK